jgi:hypothetical protein
LENKLTGNNLVEYLKNLQGQIDSVALLASSFAATVSPVAASLLLAQCAKLREKAAQGAALDAYEEGFLRIEDTVLGCLQQASDAEKFRSLSGPATRQ